MTSIVAKATGVSTSTVKRVVNEAKRNEGNYRSPKQRYESSRERIIVDDFDRAAIRRTIHSFFARKEYPTLTKVLGEV